MGKDLKGKELGEGLSQRKDGSYSARFRSKSGKRIEKYFDKIYEAKRWLADMKYAERHGNISASNNMTVDVWFKYWLDNIKGDTIRDGSKTVYKNRYKSRIQPVMGNMIISDVKPLHCQNVLTLSNREGEAYDSNKKLRSLMYSLFQSAVENDIIIKNPITKSVKCLGDKSEERQILSQSEQASFLKEAEKCANYNVFAFVLQTGLRGGELSGLKWSDVDWKCLTITVSRSLEFKEGKFVEGPAKTDKSLRTIPLTKTAFNILKQQKKIAESRTITVFEYHEYIFLNRNGKPNHRHIYNRQIKAIGEKIGVFGLSMHCLRHSFATRCIESGMNPKTLQKIMGHSSIKITMDLYVHVTDDTAKTEMLLFEKMGVQRA